MILSIPIAASENPKSLAEATFKRLQRDILECRLLPGQKLGFGMLREIYQVSFSPLREALSRLSSLELVVSDSQRGFTVVGASAEDLLDLTKKRVWSESIALRSALRNGDRHWEADILAALHRVTARPMKSAKHQQTIDPDWEIQHRAFHKTLVAACGSPRLLLELEHLYDLTDRYRRLAVQLGNAGRDADSEHRALGAAALKRDQGSIVSLIETHIVGTTEIVLELFQDYSHGSARNTAVRQLRAQIRSGLSEDPRSKR